eukprot:908407-Prymnesium_polylepis.1
MALWLPLAAKWRAAFVLCGAWPHAIHAAPALHGAIQPAPAHGLRRCRLVGKAAVLHRAGADSRRYQLCGRTDRKCSRTVKIPPLLKPAWRAECDAPKMLA